MSSVSSNVNNSNRYEVIQQEQVTSCCFQGRPINMLTAVGLVAIIASVALIIIGAILGAQVIIGLLSGGMVLFTTGFILILIGIVKSPTNNIVHINQPPAKEPLSDINHKSALERIFNRKLYPEIILRESENFSYHTSYPKRDKDGFYCAIIEKEDYRFCPHKIDGTDLIYYVDCKIKDENSGYVLIFENAMNSTSFKVNVHVYYFSDEEFHSFKKIEDGRTLRNIFKQEGFSFY